MMNEESGLFAELNSHHMAWSHRIVEMQGQPAQILIEDRYRAIAPIRELPRLAWFGVYCRQNPGTSFWAPEESASLDTLEDGLIKLCGEFGHGFAVYVMRIATRGIREYYIYLGGSANFSQVLPKLRSTQPDYRIEYEETADSDWKRYIGCLPAA